MLPCTRKTLDDVIKLTFRALALRQSEIFNLVDITKLLWYDMLLNEIYVLKHLRLRHDLQFLIHSIVCLCILYGVHTSYFSIKLWVPTVRFQHPLCILLCLFSPSGYLPSWFPSGITRPFHRDLCDHLGIFIFFEFTFRVCITVSPSNLTSMKWQGMGGVITFEQLHLGLSVLAKWEWKYDLFSFICTICRAILSWASNIGIKLGISLLKIIAKAVAVSVVNYFEENNLLDVFSVIFIMRTLLFAVCINSTPSKSWTRYPFSLS